MLNVNAQRPPAFYAVVSAEGHNVALAPTAAVAAAGLNTALIPAAFISSAVLAVPLTHGSRQSSGPLRDCALRRHRGSLRFGTASS